MCYLVSIYRELFLGFFYYKLVEIIWEELLNVLILMNESVCFLDFMVEFIVIYMMKILLIDLYR